MSRLLIAMATALTGLVGLASTAQAEVLSIEGMTPANSPEFVDIQSIAMEGFGGRDGRALAFTSSLYPNVEATDEAQKAEADRREKTEIKVSTYEAFPVRSWDKWRDDRKTHPFVLALTASGEPDGAPRALLAGTDIAAGDGYRGSGSPTWTPDGRALIYGIVTNGNEGARAMTPTHLYRVPVAGGEPRRITPDGASWSVPMFSADGKALYARRTLETEWVYNLPQLVRTIWNDSEKLDYRAVAVDLDRPIRIRISGRFGVVAAGEDQQRWQQKQGRKSNAHGGSGARSAAIYQRLATCRTQLRLGRFSRRGGGPTRRCWLRRSSPWGL